MTRQRNINYKLTLQLIIAIFFLQKVCHIYNSLLKLLGKYLMVYKHLKFDQHVKFVFIAFS